MNIGFDVDGVLTDIATFQINHGTKYFKRMPTNVNCYDVKGMFECNEKESKKFWKKYIWKYCLLERPRKYASTFMLKLRKQGHKIYIITSRVHCTEQNVMGCIFRFMLKFWLRRNGFSYDQIYFCDDENSATEKLNYCKKLNVTVMFEDNVENIMALKKQAKVICMHTDYNQDLHAEDVMKISKFDECIW